MTPRTSPAPRSPRLAALTQPASSLIALPFAQTVLSAKNARRAMIVKGSSGVGDGARGAREKGRQMIAETDHPRLVRLRPFRLRAMARPGLRRREHDHGRLGVWRTPLGRSGPFGAVRPAIGTALLGGRRPRARPLGGAMLGRPGAASAAPTVAGEIELGPGKIGHRGERNVLADQLLDRRDR